MDGQQRVYPGGVVYNQRRLGANSLKIVVNVPNVNGVINSPGGKRKGLYHGTNCTQSFGFSRHGGSIVGSNQANLNGTTVRHFGLAGKNLEGIFTGD